MGSFKSGNFVVYDKGRDGSMIYVVYINGKQIPVAHATLEEARNAMNEYYREHPRKLRKPQNILVIDEIQSKRHQEGRERGYLSKKGVEKKRTELQKDLAEAKAAIDVKESEIANRFGMEVGTDEFDEVLYKKLSKEERDEIFNMYEKSAKINTDLDTLEEFEESVYSGGRVPSAPFEKN